VKTQATEAFASRLKAGRHLTIPYARHDLLLERDSIRSQFWAAFDAFVPGCLDEPRGRPAAQRA
jgi:lysophospholipase